LNSDMEKHIFEVSTNFKRGSTEMLLLFLLSQGDRYPYELSKELKVHSGGLFDVQGPSLYTVLYRLEQKGYVSTWEARAGRRIRVYYHLLPSGEEVLRGILREYRAIGQGIENVIRKVESGVLRKDEGNGSADDPE